MSQIFVPVTGSGGGVVTSVTGPGNVTASPTTGNVVVTLNGPYSPSMYNINGLVYGNTTSGLLSTPSVNNAVLVTNNTGGPFLLPAGTTGQILQTNSGSSPSWSTSTYPSTNPINTLLYASSANIMAALPTIVDGVLVTDNTGMPFLLANGSIGQVLTANAGGSPTWQTAAASGGTVTSVSVVSANGFTGTVATATTTPAITLTTSASGVLLGNGTAISGVANPTNPGEYVEYNGTTVGYFNWLQEVRFCEDFLCSSVTLPLWKNLTANGGTFTNPITPDSGHPGVIQIGTGSSTNGESILSLGQINTSTLGNLVLGGGAIDTYYIFKLSQLSNGSDTYEISVGLGDTQNYSNTSFDNGVFFNYSSTINSGNWQGSTSSATNKATLNSAIAVTTNWTTLRINVNAAATLCTFYVNGTSIGTINTEIPTTTVSPTFTIAKSAGTTNINMNIDLFYMYQYLTNTR
jgi:hypothetical protein